jgi:hypothetical protein
MLKWLKKLFNLFRRHKVAEFATLDDNQANIPYKPNDNPYGLAGLTNPDNVLSGTNRGTQFVGSASLQIDSTQNLITVKGGTNNANNVLRFGQISSGFLGMAVNNGTLDTMFAGQDSTGSTVVKIAKPGYDAKTATNDQLVFNSGQNVFKIVLSGTTTLTTPASMTAQQVVTVTIPHNLGSSPAFSVFGASPVSLGFPGAGNLSNLPLLLGGGNGILTLVSQAYVDSTNLYIQVLNNYNVGIAGVGGTWTYRYYIYQETAATT